jgi:hypothetical protein
MRCGACTDHTVRTHQAKRISNLIAQTPKHSACAMEERKKEIKRLWET